MRILAMLALLLVLSISLTGCTNPSTKVKTPKAEVANRQVDSELSALQIVREYITANQIDVSKLEPYYAEIDTAGMFRAGSIADLGQKVWVVKYGLRRKADGIMALGGGILFWINAETGQVVMAPEVD